MTTPDFLKNMGSALTNLASEDRVRKAQKKVGTGVVTKVGGAKAATAVKAGAKIYDTTQPTVSQGNAKSSKKGNKKGKKTSSVRVHFLRHQHATSPELSSWVDCRVLRHTPIRSLRSKRRKRQETWRIRPLIGSSSGRKRRERLGSFG